MSNERDSISVILAEFLRDQGLWRRDAQVIVALSGGPDSLALLHSGMRLIAHGGPRLIAAHFNHDLRPEATGEAAFVAQIVGAWGVPLVIGRAQPSEWPRAYGLQAAARAARYAWLAARCREYHADALLVGHTADDQAETVLLNLLNGAASSGLAAMRPSTPWATWAALAGDGPPLLRPLLWLERATIEAYCAAHELAPLRDPSNDQQRFRRVWVRQVAMPLLRQINPNLGATLGRSAAILAAEDDLLEAQVNALWPEVVAEEAGHLRLDRVRFLILHRALQRRIVRRCLRLLNPALRQHYDLIEWLCDRISAARSGAWNRAVLIQVDQATATLRRLIQAADDRDQPQLYSPDIVRLLPAGSLALAQGGQLVWAVDAPTPPQPRYAVRLDPACLALGPLGVRGRRPGDRIGIGHGRHTRLQDLFVNAKIAHALRAHWPLLVAGETILWMVGLRADPAFCAAPDAPEAITIRLEVE